MINGKIKTLIVEDVKEYAELLISLLNEHAPNIDVVDVKNDFNSAYNFLSNNKVDLVFLDVELGNTNGLDLIRQLKEVDFNIIVTTAYDKYALKAFQINAIHYLLKPISVKSLQEALERVEKDEGSKKAKFENIEIKKIEEKRIKVSTDEGIYFISPKDVVCIQASGSYSEISTINGRKLLSSNLLKYYDGLLDDARFYRVSRSAIINLQYLLKYKKFQGGMIELMDGTELAIPRRKREEFNLYLDKLFGN